MNESPRAGGSGRLFVISAPSGAGKTSLVKALLEGDAGIRFSTSFTTRMPRDGEVDGRDYHFVSAERFQSMLESEAFLEHAVVFDVVLEIDWQGARQVRDRMPGCISVFVLPPSLAELERRLRGRSTDSEQTILRRLGDARDDMTHWREFDYAVINDDFDTALGELKDIVAGEGDACRTDDPEQRRRVAAVMA